jgi:hypothetical protein
MLLALDKKSVMTGMCCRNVRANARLDQKRTANKTRQQGLAGTQPARFEANHLRQLMRSIMGIFHANRKVFDPLRLS